MKDRMEDPTRAAGPAGGGAGGDGLERLPVTVVVALAILAGLLTSRADGALAGWQWLPYLIAYATGGYPIARDSWRALRDERKLSIDFLMGVAAVGAALVGSPMEGMILIFLFSLSNTLEAYAMGRTRRAIGRLTELKVSEASLVDENGREVGRIQVEELRPGARILVRPGERIAADGQVESGRSDIDQAAITGESLPVPKTSGDEVFAGTINLGGALVVRVTREAGETMLARIIRLVEEAREQRAPAQHFIDRFAHPYTLAVLLATTLVALVPPLLPGGEWAASFYRAMTLLVVASPCALVISTPAAILSGIANGARNGILFKGGAYLDLAGTIDTVVFDKTGTLTEGRPQLTGVLALDGEEGSAATGRAAAEDRLLTLAAALERSSEHHLARAVLREAERRGIPADDVEEFQALPGEGVRGRWRGAEGWVGNAAMARRMGADISEAASFWVQEQASLGRSVVFVGAETEVRGAISFGDTLKPDASATVRHLKEEGIRWVAILSGDHPQAVAAIAAELGADEVRAGLLPHEKAVAVRELTSRSRGVAMVGDGVNDAPAMAASTLGIAMGAAGTDVAIETADVVLMSDEVQKVEYVIRLGRRTRRVVRQNVVFSVGWMLLLVATALTVAMPLTLAVVAHEGSTLLVALNGLRLLRGRAHSPREERHGRAGVRGPGAGGNRGGAFRRSARSEPVEVASSHSLPG